MLKTEVIDLIAKININYDSVRDADAMIDSWFEYLHPYDTKEVNAVLDDCMGRDDFKYKPPTVNYLIRDLTPISDKVDLSKGSCYCPLCMRLVSEPKYHKHYERCSSVKYIVKQMEKHYGKVLSNDEIKDLYAMDQKEFDERYYKLLKNIYERTTNENEKYIIGLCLKSEDRKR